MSPNQEQRYGTSMEDALLASGLDSSALPADHPPKPLYVEREHVPEVLRAKLCAVLNDFTRSNIPLPFIHITVDKIKRDGALSSTGFVRRIETEGIKINTSGSAFLTRERGERLELASPAYFTQSPEIFIEDIHLILEKYLHHGTRTNKKVLGHSFKSGNGLKSQGEGVPAAVIVDRDSVDMRPGNDEDEHFIVTQAIRPEKIMGILDLATVSPDDQDTVFQVVEKLLSIMDSYLVKSGKINRSSSDFE